jgi:predicted nucleic-acid-binding protein
MSASVLGVDTNVLIRFLTTDDEVQSAQAQRLLSRRENQPIYVSMLVLVEAYNVMTKVKKQPVDAVLDSYRLLLRSPAVTVERADVVSIAIEDASRTRAGFADALIALQNAEANCVATATFDIRATRLDAMSPVEDFI